MVYTCRGSGVSFRGCRGPPFSSCMNDQTRKPGHSCNRAERFLHVFHIFSSICAFVLGIYLHLTVRPLKTCGFSYLLSVSAISSSFPYSVGPRENCQHLCTRVCLTHDPRAAHCSSLQSKTSTFIMTAYYLPCSHIKNIFIQQRT